MSNDTDSNEFTATGKDLDKIGEVFGIKREPGEDDASYRRHLVVNTHGQNDCTGAGIVRALQRRFRGCNIGLREDRQPACYIPPSTLWQRIKQVFIGPRMAPEYPFVEVAVVDYPRWRAVKTAVESAVNELRPAGVEFRVKMFRGTEDPTP